MTTYNCAIITVPPQIEACNGIAESYPVTSACFTLATAINLTGCAGIAESYQTTSPCFLLALSSQSASTQILSGQIYP